MKRIRNRIKKKVDVTSSLLRVDTDAIVGDDGRGGRVYFELLGGEFQDGRKRCSFWYAQPIIKG